MLLDVVKEIEVRIERHMPTMVLTHHCGDVNVDHRVVHQAVIVACRPMPNNPVRELLFFEIPSSTEWCPPASGDSCRRMLAGTTQWMKESQKITVL